MTSSPVSFTYGLPLRPTVLDFGDDARIRFRIAERSAAEASPYVADTVREGTTTIIVAKDVLNDSDGGQVIRAYFRDCPDSTSSLAQAVLFEGTFYLLDTQARVIDFDTHSAGIVPCTDNPNPFRYAAVRSP
jgi:hypothetical protein